MSTSAGPTTLWSICLGLNRSSTGKYLVNSFNMSPLSSHGPILAVLKTRFNKLHKHSQTIYRCQLPPQCRIGFRCQMDLQVPSSNHQIKSNKIWNKWNPIKFQWLEIYVHICVHKCILDHKSNIMYISCCVVCLHLYNIISISIST